jgi:hypothetical protein
MRSTVTSCTFYSLAGARSIDGALRLGTGVLARPSASEVEIQLLGLVAGQRVVFAGIERGLGIEIVQRPASFVMAAKLFALELCQ